MNSCSRILCDLTRKAPVDGIEPPFLILFDQSRVSCLDDTGIKREQEKICTSDDHGSFDPNVAAFVNGNFICFLFGKGMVGEDTRFTISPSYLLMSLIIAAVIYLSRVALLATQK